MYRNLQQRPITNLEARDIIDYYNYKNTLEDQTERLLYEEKEFFTNGMNNLRVRLNGLGIYVD